MFKNQPARAGDACTAESSYSYAERIKATSSPSIASIMGKKGQKAQAGKPKKLTPKDIGKRLDALAKKLEEELKGADLFAPLPPTEDCPICLVPLSRREDRSFYWACCGNTICVACVEENKGSHQNAE